MKKLIKIVFLSFVFSPAFAQFEDISIEKIKEMKVPEFSPAKFEAENDFDSFFYVDRNGKVPENALKKAISFYKENQSKISNKKYIAIADFTQHSSKKRLYVINMENGHVEQYLVAHGKGSDPDHNGYADKFSNIPNSNATSLGFYLTAETYYGKHGYSLRLDGMEESNSNARQREIVFHGANYVVNTGDKIGRSLGCPAVENAMSRKIIDMLKGGAVYLAYHAKYFN